METEIIEKTIHFDDALVIATYDSHIERILPDGYTSHYTEGWVCEVYEAIHDAEDNSPGAYPVGRPGEQVDYFTLAVGYEVTDFSDEELLRAAASFGMRSFANACVKKVVRKLVNIVGLGQQVDAAFDNTLCRDPHFFSEGYTCVVSARSENGQWQTGDEFALAVGYEIKDLSDAELTKGIEANLRLHIEKAVPASKYPFKAMDSEFIAALTADVKEALSGVESKYGIRLDCWCDQADSPNRVFEAVSLGMRAEFTYEGCDPDREHFGFLCHKEKLESHGIDISAYNKEFAVAGMMFRIIGLDTKQHSTNCVTVASGGDLYQLHPAYIGSILRGDGDSVEKDVLKATREQSKNLVRRSKANSDLSKAIMTHDDWCKVINNCVLWNKPTGLTADDHEKTVTLYGNPYTVRGFVFSLADKRTGVCAYRVVLSRGDDLFVAPARNVAFALRNALSSKEG